jgi:REP element-mobilizing transposase RayT
MAKSDWIKSVDRFLVSRQNLPHMQLPGSGYFTASNTHERQILSEAEREIVFQSILFHDGSKYDLDAAVVMPDHFHLLFRPRTKDTGDYSLPEIFHSIKSYSAQEIRKLRVAGGIPATRLSSTSEKGGKDATLHKMRVFQDENYDHIIRNEKDHNETLWYIVMNPVEAALCERPEDYRWLHCPVMGIVR